MSGAGLFDREPAERGVGASRHTDRLKVGWEHACRFGVTSLAAMPHSPSTSAGPSMQRSSIRSLLQAATFALPNGHPVINALDRAFSTGLAGDVVRAKDAVAALLNHDPKSAEQLAFAYRTLTRGEKINRARSIPAGQRRTAYSV